MGTKITSPKQDFINELEMQLLEGDASNVKLKILEYLEKDETTVDWEITEENAYCLKLLSLAHKDSGDFDTSADLSKKLVSYFMKRKEDEKNINNSRYIDEQLGDCHLILSIAFGHQSKFKEAVDNLEKANDYIIQPDKKAKYELTLGIIYYHLGYFPEAMHGVEKAKGFYGQIQKQIENDAAVAENKKLFVNLGLISCEHMLGLIKLDGPEKDGALTNLNNALRMAEKINKDRVLGYIYQSLGRYYLEKDLDPDEAKKFLDESYNKRNSLNDKKGIAYIYLYSGIYFTKLVRWEEAILKFEEAKREADKINAIEISIKACYWLHTAHSRFGNERKAVLFRKDYDDLTKVELIKKEKNRVQLEKLIPETELKINFKKAKETMSLAVKVIELLIPQGAKKISSHLLKKESLKKINDLRSELKLKIDDQFNKEEIPITICLTTLIDSLSEEKVACPPSLHGNNWIGSKESLHTVYDDLTHKNLIEENTWNNFENILMNDYQKNAERIKWLGSEQMLASFIRFTYDNMLLHKNFHKHGHQRIRAMFVNKEGNEFESIQNCISFHPTTKKTRQDEKIRHADNEHILMPIISEAHEINNGVMI